MVSVKGTLAGVIAEVFVFRIVVLPGIVIVAKVCVLVTVVDIFVFIYIFF